MADDGPTISEKELTDILKRAAEREAKEGPRMFTASDVLAAGRELGLAPATVQAVMSERLSERKRDVVPRPYDTRIRLSAADDRFELDVPAAGLSAASVATLGFSAFWLAFVGVWTAAASHGPMPFALFSVPFWMVVLWMVYRPLSDAFSRTRLELTPDEGVLIRRPGGRRVSLPTRELRAKLGRVQDLRLRPRGQGPRLVEALQLECGTKTHNLLTGFSEAERRWVHAELERWLMGHRD
jgi:hypothetical protein